jgi:hypothetical protein
MIVAAPEGAAVVSAEHVRLASTEILYCATGLTVGLFGTCESNVKSQIP